MITVRVTADVKDDRRVVLTLPPEVPTGPAELVVTVARPAEVPAELQEELAAWQRASANALELVERLAGEGNADEER